MRALELMQTIWIYMYEEEKKKWMASKPSLPVKNHAKTTHGHVAGLKAANFQSILWLPYTTYFFFLAAQSFSSFSLGKRAIFFRANV